MPLRERNRFYLAAGFAPVHGEKPFDDLGVGRARRAGAPPAAARTASAPAEADADDDLVHPLRMATEYGELALLYTATVFGSPATSLSTRSRSTPSSPPTRQPRTCSAPSRNREETELSRPEGVDPEPFGVPQPVHRGKWRARPLHRRGRGSDRARVARQPDLVVSSSAMSFSASRTAYGKEGTDSFHAKRVAHGGACGKTPGVPQNHRPRPEPTDIGVTKCGCCCRRPDRAGTRRKTATGLASDGRRRDHRGRRPDGPDAGR